jgi:hypothetical protein
MDCAACHQPLGKAEAAIAIFVMGDEYIYSYFACRSCGSWTVRSYHDRFLGDDSVDVLGPFPAAVGERAVALVRACPAPMSKGCECASHQALYYGLPPAEE